MRLPAVQAIGGGGVSEQPEDTFPTTGAVPYASRAPSEPPPQERLMHAFRAADTEPPPLPGRQPVASIVNDELTPGTAHRVLRESDGSFAAERASLKRSQDAIADLRGIIVDTHAITQRSAGSIEQIKERLNVGANFMSRLSLKLDMPFAERNGLAEQRVLVVEDDVDLLKVVRRLLSKLGCDVSGAANRHDAEALLAASAEPFDAALIDLRIPPTKGEEPRETEGLELIRWMRGSYSAVAVVVVSGDLDVPGLDALPVARLEKPFTLDNIRGSLYSVLGLAIPAAEPEPMQIPDTIPAPRPESFLAGELAGPLHLELVRDAPAPSTPRPYDPEEPDTSAETPEAKKSQPPGAG